MSKFRIKSLYSVKSTDPRRRARSEAGSQREERRREPQGRILATNIPFGFYEAVIARDPKGKKQLYGWRYVGFMPFPAVF